MMHRSLPFFAVALAAALLAAGCSSTGGRDDAAASVEDRGGAYGSGDAQTSGMRPGGSWAGSPLDNPDSPLYSKVIYFDFDQSDIRPEYHDMLRAHADYLLQNAQAVLTVEGHADERGSREYNIALGERRAKAVVRFLEAEGVSAGQLNTVSYGEERPADAGYGEASWSLNRRAELVY
ncbi:MAG: peptidoglycan-associated lipoprotein Pal [Gammaproteobacteria bacterium]|jgi:peptidoglycan-associated lipoprotein